jgi:hypothetical protein
VCNHGLIVANVRLPFFPYAINLILSFMVCESVLILFLPRFCRFRRAMAENRNGSHELRQFGIVDVLIMTAVVSIAVSTEYWFDIGAITRINRWAFACAFGMFSGVAFFLSQFALSNSRFAAGGWIIAILTCAALGWGLGTAAGVEGDRGAFARVLAMYFASFSLCTVVMSSLFGRLYR